MDVFDGMKTFVAAVESGSFTAAAGRLGYSPKLVSKYIAQLESRLGARLLHRTTRTLSLTGAGRRYYARCTDLIRELEDMEHELRRDDAGLSGTLRIAAPSSFGEFYVRPVVSAFRRRHPGLTIDLRLSDRFVDLAEDGFDLAIRIGRLDASGLIARRLMKTELWAVAASDYLARNGAPAAPGDLTRHNCICDSNVRGSGAWHFTRNGRTCKTTVRSNFLVNSAKVVRDLAIAGDGIGLCPDFIVAPDIEAGSLVRVLPGHRSRILDISAVYLESRHMPAKVRMLLDYLAGRFRQAASWGDLTI
jgi:DNA-binding transcriptional LysR family regulator